MENNNDEYGVLINNIRTHHFFSPLVITHITKLHNGLSHHCFKVITTHKSYFVKYSVTKVLAIKDETVLLMAVSKANLSPTIHFGDNHWLMTVSRELKIANPIEKATSNN